MLELTTDGVRNAIMIAQGECMRLGHSTLGSGHLLIGVVQVLSDTQSLQLPPTLTTDQVRLAVARAVGTRENEVTGYLPLSRDTRQALERAEAEARRRSQTQVAIAHVLLGMLSIRDCLGSMIVTALVDDPGSLVTDASRAADASRPEAQHDIVHLHIER